MSRFTVVPAAYVVLKQGNKVLLIRRANTGYMDGWYSLPSGHIAGGEPAHMAAIREVKEEVGVTIDPSDLAFVHVAHRLAETKDHERVDFGFATTRWVGEPRNMEPEKCDDMQWRAIDDLPENTIPLVVQMLANLKDRIFYSNHNFPR
jgi:8-oxo-dGTP diphosphatase